LRVGDILGRWTLVEYVDSGGNGDVWFVESAGEEAALKVLHRLSDPDDYERFRREVTACKEIDPETIAILPILDDHLPDEPTRRDRPWFVMPRAVPLQGALADTDLVAKVNAIRAATVTLAQVLERHGRHHRDVKLENLFVCDGRVVVGDLGLVKGPDDSDLTSPEKPVGPIRNLAPELAAGDPNPDLERIDVYYLAHALSRLASGREARGHIRAHESDSLAMRLPDEHEVTPLARLIDDATARDPAQRPTLRALDSRLAEWIDQRGRALEIRTEHERYAALYEQRENRNRAVLQWVVTQVRDEPVFGGFTYDVPDLDEPTPDVPGLTEGQMAQALQDLIDDGLISGEPQHVFGRREPRHFTHLYPTVAGVEQVHDVDTLLRLAAPLLRAFLDPVDMVTLPRSTEPTEVVPGVILTPPEAYFEMWLLEHFSYLDYRPSAETGGFASLVRVRATSAGRHWLYELGAEAIEHEGQLEAARVAAVRASPWIIAGEATVDEASGTVTYRSNVGNDGQGVARKVSLHLVDADGGEALMLAVPDLGQPSVLINVPLPIEHPTLSARIVWDDGTGERRELTTPNVYPARNEGAQ